MSTFLILIPLLIQLLIPKKSEALTCYKCSHNDFKKISSRSIYDRIEISLKSCRKVEFCNGNVDYLTTLIKPIDPTLGNLKLWRSLDFCGILFHFYWIHLKNNSIGNVKFFTIHPPTKTQKKYMTQNRSAHQLICVNVLMGLFWHNKKNTWRSAD